MVTANIINVGNLDPKDDSKYTGKALSKWHADRMEKHKDINTVMTKQARKLAVGADNDFPNDPVVTYMARFAE